MLTNHHRHLFVLAIALIYLLLLPVMNCTNDQLEEPATEKEIRTSAIRNRLYEILRHEKSYMNSEEEQEGQTEHLLEDFLPDDPHRRALAFHAMRGKRSTKMA